MILQKILKKSGQFLIGLFCFKYKLYIYIKLVSFKFCFINSDDRVPKGVQEENEIEYVFHVYEKVNESKDSSN